MTNKPQSEPAEVIDISQSAPAKAWADAKRFLTSAWFVLSDAALTTSVAAFSYFGFGLSGPEVALATILSIISAIALVFAFAFVRAPISQRNKARHELTQIRERLKPRLRIREALTSYDATAVGNQIDATTYVRLVISNESDAVASECSVSLLEIRPRIHNPTWTEGNITHYGINAFAGYPVIPLPLELSWLQKDTQGQTTRRNMPPRSERQIDLLHIIPVSPVEQRMMICFATEGQRKEYARPVTDALVAIRVDCDESSPRYYAVRFLTQHAGPQQQFPAMIIYEGSEQPKLESFVQEVPVPSD